MKSIKFILPEVSKILGVTVDQAYDRQRVLVAAGILKPLPGRGRGSGVLANTKNISWLLVALLVGELKTDPNSAIRAIGDAKPLSGTCPQFGSSKFVEVLDALLQNGPPNGFDWPTQIKVVRDVLSAEIRWRDLKGIETNTFFTKPRKFELNAFRIEASITNPALPHLKRLLEESVA